MVNEYITLEAICQASKVKGHEKNLCHTYGILLSEEHKSEKLNFWYIADETCSRGCKVQLQGDLADYPKPNPGDVIRIHRLAFDRLTGLPLIMKARNVVIWRAFKEQSDPISTARNPTMTDLDITRKHQLEEYYNSHLITPFNCMNKPHLSYFNVAGRVDEIEARVGAYHLMMHDGSQPITLRVFSKSKPTDSNDHYDKISQIKPSDYVIATNVFFKNPEMIDLRSNLTAGKSIQKVEEKSTLGLMIKANLAKIAQTVSHIDSTQSSSQDQSQEIAQPATVNISQTRASPQVPEQPTVNIIAPPPPHSQPMVTSTQINSSFTRLANIVLKDNQYKFYNIAGIVRGAPQELPNYGNWIFQLQDGSKPNYRFKYCELLQEPIENCGVVIVYAPVKPTDTDEHLKMVKQLKEGDLVRIQNVKSSLDRGRLKLEMNANTAHEKSIKRVDSQSQLGRQLVELCSYPAVEELTEQPSQDSMEE